MYVDPALPPGFEFDVIAFTLTGSKNNGRGPTMRIVRAVLLSIIVVVAVRTTAAETPDEKLAVAKVHALGGETTRRSELPSVAGRRGSVGALARSKTGDDPVVVVSFVDNDKLKDDDLKLLAAFPHLTDLHLGRTGTSDRGLKYLSGLNHLSRLGLIRTKITDAGLTEIARLPELHDLLVGYTAVSDSGLKELAKLPRLVYLDLAGTKVTDKGLKELPNFPALLAVSLAGTSISNNGLENLAGFDQLTVLNLSETNITDAGLEHLAGLKGLARLFLVDTKVTDAGIKRFKQSLPYVQINRRTMGKRAATNFDVAVAHPAYTEKHPRVLFDEAHRNFHTAAGGYKVFAELITNDGYAVTRNRKPFTAERLAGYNLLISANAAGISTAIKSAFSEAEIESVVDWIQSGGSLLLITDHEPFGSGSAELGKRFGVEMSLCVTVDNANETRNALLFSRQKRQLGEHPILRGRNETERIDRVLTFTGQSLKGPPDSAQLLSFSDTAVDVDQNGERRSAAGRAQGIAFRFGKGRVVVMGEASTLTAQVNGDPPQPVGMNVPGCDNRQLALNIVHWLSGLLD
jgi:hypothetical protein